MDFKETVLHNMPLLRKPVLAVFTDLAKAFDKVDYELLPAV